MDPHPAFVGRIIPERHVLGSFLLRGLGPEDVDVDLAALRESEAALKGLFDDGPWPEGITRAENLIDLCWHRREFTSNRSFAWVIAEPEGGAYLGCAYVYPGFGERSAMKAIWWFRSGIGTARAAGFPTLFLDWLAGPDWPPLPVEPKGIPAR